MSQCHDEYPELQRYHPSDLVTVPQGAACHDPIEISVLIAGSDDHTRSRIHQALAADERFGSITEAAACDDAIRRCDGVDVIVFGMRSTSGLGPPGAISELARRPHHPPIVALSPADEPWLDRAARNEGADEVLDWPAADPELVRAVISAARPD